MISFTIWITEKCNLGCKYCYEQDLFKNKRNTGKYSENVVGFITSIAELYPDEEVLITFHGGEPLLGIEVIEQYVDRLKKYFMDRVQFCITTNGTLLNEKNIEFLCKNFCDISVSLDGIKSINDKNRINKAGEGTYDLVVKNLEKISIPKHSIRIRMTITAEAVEVFYKSITELVSKGYTFLVPVVAVNDPNWNDEKICELFSQVKKLISEGYGELPFLKRLLEEPKILSRCNGGIKNFSIATDEKVYPCEYVMGNELFCLGTLGDGIGIIKKAEKYMSLYYSHNEGACAECSYEKYCDAGRCKCYNYINSGELLSPSDNQCRIEHLNYRIWREFGCQ